MAQKNVRLYYLGGLTPAGATTTPITSYEMVYMLPPAGQYLDVPEFVARDLQRKYTFEAPDGSVFSPFTQNKRLIDQMKQMQSGGQTGAVSASPKAIDTALLVAELKARGIEIASVPDETEDDDDNDTAELEPVGASPVKQRGRPRKE